MLEHVVSEYAEGTPYYDGAGPIRRIDVVEQMTMHAADYLGLDAAKSELLTIDGWDVFVTERYDRALVDGRWRRLHHEDFAQAQSVSPNNRYQHRDGGPGLADIARLIRSLPYEPADRSEVGGAGLSGFRLQHCRGMHRCADAQMRLPRTIRLCSTGPRCAWRRCTTSRPMRPIGTARRGWTAP